MLPESNRDGNFIKNREIHGESNVWSKVQDRKRAKYLMLGFNETQHQMAMANSGHWYGHVLIRKDVHVLRRALDLEVEGQRKKGKS